MSAVGALPYRVAVLGEYKVAFYVCKELSVSFFVLFFNCRNAVEEFCNIFKAFRASVFCEFRIHIRPFVVFALSRREEIFCRGGDFAAVQKLEPDFCVFLFVFRRFFNDCRNLHKAFFLCFACKIGVFVSCLRFACKSRLQIRFRFRAF